MGWLLAATVGWSLLSAGDAELAQAQSKSGVDRKRAETRHTFPVSKFYDTPNPLPAGKPGALIRSETFEQYDLPAHVLAVRILYHSVSASGKDVAASGVVLYPDGKPPADGWPVIAWAHDLNGVARSCAPSLDRSLRHGPFLSMYVKLGFAVVATDYAGLGTDSRNAFSDLQSNASDVMYSVPAARAALPQLGSRWIAIGLGQGGPAALGIAELAGQTGDHNYLGSLAISGLDDLQEYENPGARTVRAPLFLAFGIKAIYPEFDMRDILTDKALALFPQVEQACGEPTEASKLAPSEMLKPSFASSTLVKQYFDRNTLGLKPAKAPILVITGELDSTFPTHGPIPAISRMCKQGDPIQIERYGQSERGRVFGDSVEDQLAWIQARFAGRAPKSNCSDQR